MHACPHCGGPGIATARKRWLGPAIRARCRACGRTIGVPWSAPLAGRPGLAVLLPCAAVASPPARALRFVAGVLVTAYVHVRYVPLVRRGPGLRGTLGRRDERREAVPRP